MPATTLREASARFGDFYVPAFKILVAGAALDESVVRDVIQVTYNDSITEIDSFDVTVNNWDPVARRFKYVGSEERAKVDGATPEARRHMLFEPCAREFELKLGYGSEPVTIMRGSTTSLEPAFPSGGAPTLTVRALNALHKLRTKQYRTNWTERGAKRISQVAEELGRANDNGHKRFPMPIRIDRNAQNDEPREDSIIQDNQYDIDFLLLHARRVGYVVYLDQERVAGSRNTREVLYFGPSNAQHPGVPSVTYELKWGISLIDFTPKLSIANQVKSVEVRSWNRQTNRAIKKKVDLHHRQIRVNRDLMHMLERDGCQPREQVVVNEPQRTPEEAERRALAVLSERLKQLVEATGTTVGLPDLRAGQRVHIVGLGARFSGVYFVVKTTHTINDNGYVTKFTARREAPLEGASP